jgi:phosphoesterase RecJ-like protein
LKTKITKKKIKEFILNSNNFLITAHKNPDLDAISSLSFMVNFLLFNKKQVFWKMISPINPKFKDIIADIKKYKYSNQKIDVVVYLDCTSKERTGLTFTDNSLTVNIDHHPSNSFFCNFNYVKPTRSSTSEILYDLFCPDKTISDNIKLKKYILLGIIGDTGFLKYENTTSHTFKIVSEITKDVSIFDIYKKYYQVMTIEHYKYFSYLIKKLTYAGNGLYYIALTYNELLNCKLSYDDISELFALFRDIKGARILLFFREYEPRNVRINLRGNDDIDLNKIANRFGGGGHEKAAAVTLQGSLNTIIKKVLNIVGESL